MKTTENLATTIPTLENGDRLTRHEFERRYEAMPHVKKAELIEGVVYVASPIRYRRHGKPHGYIMAWLGLYCEYVPLTPDDSGVIKSRIFPGLDLPVAVLLAGNLAIVLAEVQKGVTTEVHQAFVRITVNPKQMGGVPCIRGLRIPVATVVGMVADGRHDDEKTM